MTEDVSIDIKELSEIYWSNGFYLNRLSFVMFILWFGYSLMCYLSCSALTADLTINFVFLQFGLETILVIIYMHLAEFGFNDFERKLTRKSLYHNSPVKTFLTILYLGIFLTTSILVSYKYLLVLKMVVILLLVIYAYSPTDFPFCESKFTLWSRYDASVLSLFQQKFEATFKDSANSADSFAKADHQSSLKKSKAWSCYPATIKSLDVHYNLKKIQQDSPEEPNGSDRKLTLKEYLYIDFLKQEIAGFQLKDFEPPIYRNSMTNIFFGDFVVMSGGPKCFDNLPMKYLDYRRGNHYLSCFGEENPRIIIGVDQCPDLRFTPATLDQIKQFYYAKTTHSKWVFQAVHLQLLQLIKIKYMDAKIHAKIDNLFR